MVGGVFFFKGYVIIVTVKLSYEKLKIVSGILSNLGQICVASLVVPFFVGSENNLSVFVFGSLLAILFWSLGIAFVKEKETISI